MGLKGNDCPSCDTLVVGDASHCHRCGSSPAAAGEPRRARVVGNSWQAQPDEFAASLTAADLDGIVTKRLEVRPGFRALIFHDGKLQNQVPPGEYNLDGLPSRLYRLGRNNNQRLILIRQDELPVDFRLTDLLSREYLALELTLTLGVRVAEPVLFAGRLEGDGRVFTRADMRRLLLPQLRQLLAEALRAKSIRELHPDAGLRGSLGRHIQAGLARLAQDNGLALGEVTGLAVGHSQYDANNRERGKTWLLVDQERAALERRQALDELYSAEEWSRIARLETEQQIRAKARELALGAEGDDLNHRLRRIELLEQIRRAEVREAVIEQDARAQLADLELAAKRAHLDRDDQQAAWAHLRKLAEIRRDTEQSLAGLDQEQLIARARAELDRERVLAQFDQESELAARQDSEKGRRMVAELQHRRVAEAFRREQELEELLHQQKMDAIRLQMEAARREAQRIQDYLDSLGRTQRPTPGPAQPSPGVNWCASCRAGNPVTNNRCHQCGKPLA